MLSRPFQHREARDSAGHGYREGTGARHRQALGTDGAELPVTSKTSDLNRD